MDWFNISFYAGDISLCNKYYDGRDLSGYTCAGELLNWVLANIQLNSNLQNYYLLKAAKDCNVEGLKILLNKYTYSQKTLIQVATVCPKSSGQIILPCMVEIPNTLATKYDLVELLDEKNIISQLFESIQYNSPKCIKSIVDKIKEVDPRLCDNFVRIIDKHNIEAVLLLNKFKLPHECYYKWAKVAIEAVKPEVLALCLSYIELDKRRKKLHLAARVNPSLESLFYRKPDFSVISKTIVDPETHAEVLRKFLMYPGVHDDEDWLIRAITINAEAGNVANTICLLEHIRVNESVIKILFRCAVVNGSKELIKYLYNNFTLDKEYLINLLDEAIDADISVYVRFLFDLGLMVESLADLPILFSLDNEHIETIKVFVEHGMAGKIRELYDGENVRECSIKFSAQLTILLC